LPDAGGDNSLLQLDLGASRFELLLCSFGIRLVDAFLDSLWSGFNQILGFFEAEAGDGAAAAAATGAAADTPHFSSSILESSAASRTVRLERSFTILLRSAILFSLFFKSVYDNNNKAGYQAALSLVA
jgi:hypothetical protein